MTSVNDPADLTVLDAAALLRERKLSAVELLAACQRRISERNGGAPTFDGSPGAVNAWVRLYPELALEQAREADRRLSREKADAPLLCGIPLGLKDLCGVAGQPLTASSRVLDGHRAEQDCTAWARLRASGMVLLGHTHTHEFAAGGTTDQVGNPHALDRSAGGSSGGSAAALAAGMVSAALGTDTAGSLRIPAALSGVCSIKPTRGRVPLDGVIPLAHTLDHIGPMARTVADCAVVLDALAAPGAECTPLMPPPAVLGSWPRPPRRDLAGLRIALTDRPGEIGVDADTAGGLRQVAQACRDLGAEVVELAAPAAMDDEVFSTILFSEVHTFHEGFAGCADRYRTSIHEFVETSALFTSAQGYLRAQQLRSSFTRSWEDWFGAHRIDLILEPTAPSTAPVRGAGYESGHLGGEGDPLIRLTATWNATGFPVAAFPAGFGDHSGLPVGVSLIGVRGAEDTVIGAATTLQQGAVPPLTATVPSSETESRQ